MSSLFLPNLFALKSKQQQPTPDSISNQKMLSSSGIGTFSPCSSSSLENISELHLMPEKIQIQIISLLSPNLASTRGLSQQWNRLIDAYIESKAKLFFERQEEAKAWGDSKPLELENVLLFDPLVISRIIKLCYGFENSKRPSPLFIQKQLFKSFQFSILNYTKLWFAVKPIRDAILDYGLHYDQRLETHELFKSDSDDDFGDLVVKEMSLKPEPQRMQVMNKKNDEWKVMNSELFKVAAVEGNVDHFSSPLDLVGFKDLLIHGVKQSIINIKPNILVYCLEASRIKGWYWELLDLAIETALFNSKKTNMLKGFSRRNSMCSICLIILDGLFNDKGSPYKSVIGNDEQDKSRARELLEKGMELAKMNGIVWNKSRMHGRYMVLNASQVVDEVRRLALYY